MEMRGCGGARRVVGLAEGASDGFAVPAEGAADGTWDGQYRGDSSKIQGFVSPKTPIIHDGLGFLPEP